MQAELEHRPLLVAALGLALGLAGGIHLWVLALWVSLILLLISSPIRYWAIVSGLVGAVLAPTLSPDLIHENEFVDADATVYSASDFTATHPEAVIIVGHFHIKAWVPASIELGQDDVIHITGIIQPIPEGMDGIRVHEGIDGLMFLEPEQIKVLKHGTYIFWLAQRWRDAMLNLTQRSLTKDDAAMVDAICFRTKWELDSERKLTLDRTGLTHIIAASGLHVLVLGALLQALFGLLPIPRGLSLGLVGGTLLLYAASTGLHPPAVRSALMAISGSFAYLFCREADSLSSLSLAALVVLLWHPGDVYDGGFHLSFAVVAAIALYSRQKHQRTLMGELRHVVRATLIASFAAAPITAYMFGTISLVGAVANIFVILVAAPIIALSMLALLISPIADGLSILVMHLAGTLANTLGAFLDFLGTQSWIAIDVPPFSAWWMIPLYGAPVLFWRKHLRQP